MYSRDPYVYNNHDAIPAAIIDVTIGVLASWDMQQSDYQYVERFHADGVLHVGLEPAKGHAAIRSLHNEMIKPTEGPVVNAQHYVDRCFISSVATDGTQEAIITGSLVNTLLDGQTVTHDFASWVIMSPNEVNTLKAVNWRVFTNPMELVAAITALQAKGKARRDSVLDEE